VPAPFYNAIKGTTAGTPGTSAFTPNAASTGYRAWSTVPSGWIGLVRYDDGAPWELCYSYWNGTTLSRASTQLYDSSSGSAISLTSSATAAMIEDGGEIASHLGTTPWAWTSTGFATTTTITNMGIAAPTANGTAASQTLATTNFLTQQRRIQYTSATTASALAGWNWGGNMLLYSTSAGQGGGEFTARFGASSLPTGPRLIAGMLNASGSADPSAISAAQIAAFAKDAGDTNIQLLTKDGTTANKVDTGIPLVANGWYEASVWWEPGGGKVYGLLLRLDTGAIWLGSTTTNLPTNGTFMFPQVTGSTGTATGTAIVFHTGHMTLRVGI
jgi:hypothetical protein